jgi:hypothetical protein
MVIGSAPLDAAFADALTDAVRTLGNVRPHLDSATQSAIDGYVVEGRTTLKALEKPRAKRRQATQPRPTPTPQQAAVQQRTKDVIKAEQKLLAQLDKDIDKLLKEIGRERDYFNDVKKLELVETRSIKHIGNKLNNIEEMEEHIRSLVRELRRIPEVGKDTGRRSPSGTVIRTIMPNRRKQQEVKATIRKKLGLQKKAIKNYLDEIFRDTKLEGRIGRKEALWMWKLINKDRNVIELAEEAKTIVDEIEALRTQNPNMGDQRIAIAVQTTATALREFFEQETADRASIGRLGREIRARSEETTRLRDKINEIKGNKALFGDEMRFLRDMPLRRHEVEQLVDNLHKREAGIIRELQHATVSFDHIAAVMDDLHKQLRTFKDEIDKGKGHGRGRTGMRKAWNLLKRIGGYEIIKKKK